jgi:hypothetical protein
MKKADLNFDSIPRSALSTTTLDICLKCAFDLFIKHLKLAARTALTQLKKHSPEETDFTGASTARPHFFPAEELKNCPYCNAARRWFADFHATRIDAHPGFEKERKKLWAALKKEGERFTLLHPDRTRMQIFSEWLERLNRTLDFANGRWMLDVALETIKRSSPSHSWDEVLADGLHRIQLSRDLDGDWHYEKRWLYVSPTLYGNALMIQHLLSRTHQHGGQTFEGRLTLPEFTNRLRRTGYLDALGISSREPFEIFEQAIAKIVDSGPAAVYYAIDRSHYLERLQEIYQKNFSK